MSDDKSQEPGGAWSFIRREPLVHFLGIAALLFVANAVFQGDDREVISVDLETQEYLVTAQEELILRPLTDEERQDIIDNFIEEEVLVREARARGFDDSSRIRALMIQNMRFFLSNELPTPSEADLRAHYENNPDRFTTRPRATYERVFFADPASVPADILEQLNQGADFAEFGDPLTSPVLRQADMQALVTVFGPDAARRILEIDDDRWHGPFESSGGMHFLRVREKYESQTPAFDDIRNWIENDWQMFMSRKSIEDALAEMLDNYIIDIEQPTP